MYHLVYTSFAKEPFSQTDLVSLLNQSRAFNKANGITGMLIYHQGKFIQALEGDMTKVRKLYAQISGDSRHRKVTKLMEGDSARRIFKNWSMGFKIIVKGELNDLTGFQDLEVFFRHQKQTEDTSLVLVFLQLFYKKNLVDYPEHV